MIRKPNSLRQQTTRWPKHHTYRNGRRTYAHEIEFVNYVDAIEYRPFNGHHHQEERGITYRLLNRADPNLVERAERDGFAAPDCRVKFGESCDRMSNWQAPEYQAKVHLYDVGATPRVSQPVIFEAHYGPMVLDNHVNPSCGIICPPNVMSNEAVVLLQRPAEGESIHLKVKYMPVSGNILINDVTDPDGIVLEARSGRFYAPAQVENEEFLSDRARAQYAREQAYYNRTQREVLEKAQLMRVMNDELNPPQTPALVLSNHSSYEAAERSQFPNRNGNPPTSSASAQTPRSNVRMPGQHRGGGRGRAVSAAVRIREEENVLIAQLPSMIRAKEACRLASVYTQLREKRGEERDPEAQGAWE